MYQHHDPPLCRPVQRPAGQPRQRTLWPLVCAAALASGCGGREASDAPRAAQQNKPADFCGPGDNDQLHIERRLTQNGIVETVTRQLRDAGVDHVTIDLEADEVRVGEMRWAFNICSYNVYRCYDRVTEGGICGGDWSAGRKNCAVSYDGDRILLRCGIAPAHDSVLRHELVHVVQWASTSLEVSRDCYYGEMGWGDAPRPRRYTGTDRGDYCADPCTIFMEAFADYVTGMTGHYGAYWRGTKTNASNWFRLARLALGSEAVDAAGLSPTARNVERVFDACLERYGYVDCWNSFRFTLPNLSNTMPAHLRTCDASVAPRLPAEGGLQCSEGPSCREDNPITGSCVADQCLAGQCCGWVDTAPCSCGPQQVSIGAGHSCSCVVTGPLPSCPSVAQPGVHKPQGSCENGHLCVGEGQELLGHSCDGCWGGWVPSDDLC